MVGHGGIRSDFIVLQKRKQESERLKMSEAVKEDFKRGAYAQWEQRTDGVIRRRAVQQRFDSIRAADKQLLIERRRKLSEMLRAEDEAFERQIEALGEGPEARRERMESRARELRNKREETRRTYVQEQLDRQWRLSCDPLRNADSANIAKACDAARGYQIEERMALLELEQQEEKVFADMWVKDAEAKERREAEEEAQRRAMDEEQMRILARQTAEKQALRDADAAERERAAELMAQQWQAEKDAQEVAEVERRKAQYAAKLELDSFNVAKRSDRARAYAKELEEDKARLDSVLSKEAEDERLERAHHERLKQESLAYQRHLQLLMAKEAADEAELEKAREADLGKAWDKRVAEWGREQAAREQLLQVTLEGRQKQIEDRQRDRAAARAHHLAELDVIQREVERVNKLEQIKRENEQKRQLEHSAYLKTQMQHKHFSKQLEANSKVLERQAIERAEAEYVARVKSEMAKTQSVLWG